MKELLQRALRRFGYRLERVDPDRARYQRPTHAGQPLPAGAAEVLRPDHPRLLELRERYGHLPAPWRQHSLWHEAYREAQLDLRHFRGDNAYLWQYRQLHGQARFMYYLFAQYVRGFDQHGLLERLGEDGQFGCWTFGFEGLPLLSRDLLESVNELYFLERHCELFARPGLRVLDIGAGYGRLAHRATQAAPGIGAYVCMDAIPESTFLCEYYLKYRGAPARVVPADEIDALAGEAFDVALNIHSFSEMSRDAIALWLDRIAAHRIPWLLIVPNDGEDLLSVEADGVRHDFAPLLRERGYRLRHTEPVFRDRNVRELIASLSSRPGHRPDHFLLFEAEQRAS
jgi:SAM-dependent methyltransferase